jgi:hypothetical protein
MPPSAAPEQISSPKQTISVEVCDEQRLLQFGGTSGYRIGWRIADSVIATVDNTRQRKCSHDQGGTDGGEYEEPDFGHPERLFPYIGMYPIR